MESSSQETKTSSQPNHGTSFSALIDAIALQEQCFEQSLASQQLWSQKLADTQEAKIKAAVQKIIVGATEVDEILKGKKIIASEVKTEDFNSESKEGEPLLQSPSQQFSRSRSRSTSLPQHPEVYKEHRRSPRDYVSKRDLGNFNSYTFYDCYKDRPRLSHGENISASEDGSLHAFRRSPSIERSWNRESRSPSKSRPQRYRHEDFRSLRSGSVRCQTGDSRGRNYHRMGRSPMDDSNPHYEWSIDGGKHRARRGVSPLARSWKRERRSPSKSKPQRYHHKGSHSPRSGSFGCQSGDSRGRNYRRVDRSPIDDSNPYHQRSIDSRKHRETSDASLLEIVRSHKSRGHLADDHNNDHGDNWGEKISEPSGTRSGYQSKQTAHVNSQDYATSEALNAKATCLASACVSTLQDHQDTKQLLLDPTESTCYPLREWRSEQRLEPQGRMKLGRKHYRRNEGEEESEKDARENKKMKRRLG